MKNAVLNQENESLCKSETHDFFKYSEFWERCTLIALLVMSSLFKSFAKYERHK